MMGRQYADRLSGGGDFFREARNETSGEITGKTRIVVGKVKSLLLLWNLIMHLL